MFHRSSSARENTVLEQPVLCYVTDRRSLTVSRDSDRVDVLVEKIKTLAAAGVDWIQLREKDLSGREYVALTRRAVEACARMTVRILVNDRLDVAIAEGAHGIHLGENALPVSVAGKIGDLAAQRSLRKRTFTVGFSCHSFESAQEAAAAGADYIIFGPVYGTPSKAAFGAPQGLERLAEVCGSLAIPVVAIGGISVENAGDCVRAGAQGIAAIRLFQESSDARALVSQLRGPLRPRH